MESGNQKCYNSHIQNENVYILWIDSILQPHLLPRDKGYVQHQKRGKVGRVFNRHGFQVF